MESMLIKTDQLQKEIIPMIAVGPFDNDKRILGSWVMCDTALEHAHSLHSLMSIGNFTSAVAMLRLQFDALTRSVWLLYAASEANVERIMQDLTIDSANADNGLPSHKQMIDQIAVKAPPEATRLLSEFRDVTWKASCSYVHSGLHTMKRHAEGYPVPLLKQIMQSSNGLLMLCTIQIAIMAKNEHIAKDIIRIRDSYRDILPKLNL